MTPEQPFAPQPQDSSPSTDSLSMPAAPAPSPSASSPPPAAVAGAKKTLLVFGGTAYAAFAAWSGFLLLLLPDANGDYKQLASVGLMTSLGGAVVLLLAGWVGLQRIAKSSVSIPVRQRGMIKMAVVLIPGLALAGAVPYFITREPPLSMDITQPTRAQDLVAPVSVTFSLERAAEVLRKQGLRPVKYQWDTDGDGTQNEETILPTVTALYARQGAYSVVARVVLEGNQMRRVTRRLVIPQAVFSVAPERPVLEQPVRLSVSHLLPDPKQLAGVTWDYGDGTEPKTSLVPDVVHTYYATGEYTVSALLQLTNNTQAQLKRTIVVREPSPLPFPVTVISEPQNPTGPAPFGALFRVETDEPLKEIAWDFGDGKEERGADLRRVGHSFERPGAYPVVARVRSASGQLAELTTLVRATETLSISDLRFEGTPVTQGNKLRGEAPFSIRLTPKTLKPLITFLWEAPDTDEFAVNGDTIEATYRNEGSYSIVLLGQDAEGKAMRLPLTVEVTTPAARPDIVMRPESGTAPLRVTFDASNTFVPPDASVAGFKWLFGDEGQGARAVQLAAARVEHVYKLPGEYVVTLSVVLTSGEELQTRKTIVVQRPPLSACITVSRLRVQVGKGVEFDSSCSAGVVSSYLWDVRHDAALDAVLAQSPNPSYVHVFEIVGTYTVRLTVKDERGNQDTKTVSISVQP